MAQAIGFFFLKSDCPLIRYRKYSLDGRRDYLKIQKSNGRKFLCQNICFWGWGIQTWG